MKAVWRLVLSYDVNRRVEIGADVNRLVEVGGAIRRVERCRHRTVSSSAATPSRTQV